MSDEFMYNEGTTKGEHYRAIDATPTDYTSYCGFVIALECQFFDNRGSELAQLAPNTTPIVEGGNGAGRFIR